MSLDCDVVLHTLTLLHNFFDPCLFDVDMYKIYQIFIMILKFDIFFQLGFSAQFLSVIVLSYMSAIEKSNGGPSPSAQAAFRNVLVIHLVLSVGACIVLPVLAWRGVSASSIFLHWSAHAFWSIAFDLLPHFVTALQQTYYLPFQLISDFAFFFFYCNDL